MGIVMARTVATVLAPKALSSAAAEAPWRSERRETGFDVGSDGWRGDIFMDAPRLRRLRGCKRPQEYIRERLLQEILCEWRVCEMRQFQRAEGAKVCAAGVTKQRLEYMRHLMGKGIARR